MEVYSIPDLARLLDCEQWRARRAVDIVTQDQCPRIGRCRFITAALVPKVRAFLEAREKERK